MGRAQMKNFYSLKQIKFMAKKASWKKFGIVIAVILIASIVSIAIFYYINAISKKAVTFKFNEKTDQILLKINSPVGVYDAQVKIEISGNVSVMNFSATGFMDEAMHLWKENWKNGQRIEEHRWFTFGGWNRTQASVAIKFYTFFPKIEKPVITLLGIDLLDEEKNNIILDAQFPMILNPQISPDPIMFPDYYGKT